MTPTTLAAAIGCSQAKAELYAPYIDGACQLFAINTPARLAAFLAQIGHESGGLQYTEELASGEAYEGRASLGNTEPGDGARFRGHGLIQTTGRFNHRATTNGLRAYGAPDFEAEPERLSEPRWAALSAGWYWSSHGCNELADADAFEAITKRINGGLNGQADRLKRWEKAKAVLMMAGATQTPTTPETAPQAQPEAKMPFPAIIAALLPTIIEAIPKLGALFKGGEVATRNVKVAELAFDLVKTATGAANEQEAVEKIKADPVALQNATQAIQDNWFALTDAGGGIVEARKADVAFVSSGAKPWQSPAFIISLVLLLMPFMLLVDAFFVHSDAYPSELRTQIVTGVLMVVGIVGGYWLGSSFGSARKTELGAQQ